MIGSIWADRYEIRALLGEGAMASVYEAFDSEENRSIALKIPRDTVLSSSELRARFEREAHAATQVDHPALVRAFGLGHTPLGIPYLIFERVSGDGLVEALSPLPVPWPRALRICAAIAGAARALHARGIIHRDLKPENILLTRAADGEDLVKVLDFGVAKIAGLGGALEENMTRVGHVYGTPEYMAPEQALGQPVDERADVYSLGVILFELLTGRRPYTGKSNQLLGQQLTEPIPALSALTNEPVPDELEALVRQMLAVTCVERPSMSTVRERLIGLAEGRTDSKPKQLPERVAHAADRPQTSTFRMAVVAVISLAVGGLGVLAWTQRTPTPSMASARDTRSSESPIAVPAPSPSSDDPVLSPDALSRATLDELITLSREHSSEPLIQLALARAYFDAKDYGSAVETAATSLALDPSLNRSRELAALLFKTAQMQSSQDATFRLLRGPMGQEGADILYQLSLDSSVKPLVRFQAGAALAAPELRENLSLPLALALDLASAHSCKDLLPLFEKAEIFGDSRSLTRLESFQKNLDCKRQGLPCYPCLRPGITLGRAITAIRERERSSEAKQ